MFGGLPSYSFFILVSYSSFSLSMVSSSTLPCLSEMVELRANGVRIPLLFPVDASGFASVSSLHLSIRFSLQNSSIWVEREIYDNATSFLSLTMREHSRVADNGSPVWVLSAGKYRVYGLPDSCSNVSTEICTPPVAQLSMRSARNTMGTKKTPE